MNAVFHAAFRASTASESLTVSRQALDIFVALHTCAAGSKFVLPSRFDPNAACRM